MADQQWSRAHVSASIALNLVSAISIVFLNKLLYVRHGFPSMTLTLLHFAITSLGLQICAWMDVFSPKRLVLKQIIPLSASFCGFVVFTNLSLQNNAVGTYQLAKAMTTPTILLIQALVYNRPSSTEVKLTVVEVQSQCHAGETVANVEEFVRKTMLIAETRSLQYWRCELWTTVIPPSLFHLTGPTVVGLCGGNDSTLRTICRIAEPHLCHLWKQATSAASQLPLLLTS